LQKFGLDYSPAGKPTTLELEIAKEKASALGVTGAKLQLSLSKYQRAMQGGTSAEEQERLICEVVENVSALLVQRELLGLVHENLLWILETNGVPGVVLSRLGLSKASGDASGVPPNSSLERTRER
jgi:hypothetical protein